MGLLSSRGFRNILLGAGSRYQELSRNALEIAMEGQKNLREIAQNLDTVEKQASKALRVVEQQSDPTFSTFLSNKGIETLMEMDDETLRAYKEQYDSLSTDDLSKLQEQEQVDLKAQSQKYYTDVAENLKKSVNIGNNSANFLLDIDPRSKKFRQQVEQTGAVAPEFDLGEVPTVPTETLGTSTPQIPSKANFVRGYVEKTLADPTSASYFQQISGGKDVGTYYSELYDILYGSSEDNISGSVKSWQDYIQQQEG